jgi:hypothetical protein
MGGKLHASVSVGCRARGVKLAIVRLLKLWILFKKRIFSLKSPILAEFTQPVTQRSQVDASVNHFPLVLRHFLCEAGPVLPSFGESS